jgi:hypothetical protein
VKKGGGGGRRREGEGAEGMGEGEHKDEEEDEDEDKDEEEDEDEDEDEDKDEEKEEEKGEEGEGKGEGQKDLPNNKQGSFQPPGPANGQSGATISIFVRIPAQFVSSGPVRHELPNPLPTGAYQLLKKN